MKKIDINSIPKEKFEFAQLDAHLHDVKFETKPVGYMLDAWRRFRKNKASVIAAVIIILIVVFAVVTPFVSKYHINDADGVYAKMRPKIEAFYGTGFLDGTNTRPLNDKYIAYLGGIGQGIADKDGSGATWAQGLEEKYQPIAKLSDPYKKQGKEYRDALVDTYYSVGFKYISVTRDEYAKIQAWQEENGIQVIYPMVDTRSEWCDASYANDANYWYRHSANSTPLDENGKKMTLEKFTTTGLVDNYLRDADGNILYFAAKDKSMISVRVLYYNYYIYQNGYEPTHTLGTDAQGYDILVRLAHGTRLSLILALCVSIINLTLGAMYGAIEGYYGGWVDMLGERVTDVLSGIPFIVVATLFQLHLVNTGKVSTLVGLLFAFVLTGWIGTAYRVRTQFYRFKNQEYVLAARTLGAHDGRIMFKHIFPNALGTIITTSVLVIPGVILDESVLSYLGVVNFNGQFITSLGTMLSNGQGYLSTDPHIILFPALIISLLMISFNLFGNGLRDAFNPSLRGADE
ncbi:MAG: ABC transporter permease [Eubacteriales bacterium]|nr:ABC transporter permease [Eubacteriales bacterium]